MITCAFKHVNDRIINNLAASLYDYCMRIEAGYPESDGIWEPVAGWTTAERQRLE
ncbi:MAG: hypothetical protein Q8O19_01775 [Rectinemataceae bacterium]|nr:hypothetical protein [Rectinemataceae bacterium]